MYSIHVGIIYLAITLLFVCVSLAAPSTSVSSSHDPLSFYDFIPVLVARLHPSSPKVQSFSARCFLNNTISYELDPIRLSATIYLSSSNAASWTCLDTFLITTQLSVHVKTAVMKGQHKWVFSFDALEYQDVVQNGIFLFSIQNSYAHVVEDVYHTAKLFIGKTTVKENIKMFKEKLGVDLKPRKPCALPDKSIFRSGDVIIQTSPTGLSTMICYGTNSPVGHIAMMLWMNGELYVVESQDDAAFSDVPPSPTVRRGISATKYEDWIKMLDKNEMTVIVPLRDDLSRKFDTEKAIKFLKSRLNVPYGYRNFFFSFFDTPDTSLPGELTWPLVLSALKMGEAFAKDKTDLLFMEGFRHRLNDKSLNSFNDVIAKLVRDGKMNFGELLSIPEQDDWIYDGKQLLICSSFAMSMLREAGVIDSSVSKHLQSTEFTPKDVSELNIYAKIWENKPVECGHPGTPFCQIHGDYVMPVEHWKYFNTINPYKNMNEKCPTMRTPDMIC
ncbi:hypothetical protein RCL1_000054 [Eukaryota sp. TZLM3-RCL]